MGAHVTLTDRVNSSEILSNCRLVCQLNKDVVVVPPSVIGFSWGDFSKEILELDPVDFVIGADIFYDEEGRSELDAIQSGQILMMCWQVWSFFWNKIHLVYS